jgi:hypothetical protein
MPENSLTTTGRLLALATLLILPCLMGCASFAEVSAPAYGRAWGDFAKQASACSGLAVAPLPKAPAMRETVAAMPKAEATVEKAKKILSSRAPTSKAIQGVMDDLAEVEEQAQQAMRHAPRRLERLRAEIATLRRIMEKKLMLVRSIEPCFAIGRHAKVRVAVLKFDNGVASIRKDEQERWKRFLTDAGFDPNPVFLSPALSGGRADAASVRVAAARLGADAVLAYATFAATTASPLGESAAVLSFAKCMFVDVYTEYLYFNAEGESRKKSVSLPFMVCAKCVEMDAVSTSIEALRVEITVELKRLALPDQTND